MGDGWREPFVALLVVVAVAFGVLVWGNRAGTADAAATFTGAQPTAFDVPTAAPLPTPLPSGDVEPALVDVSYAADAITLSGTVTDQVAFDAVVAAAGRLVGAAAVTVDLTVDPSLAGSGVRVTLRGTVRDDAERANVVGAFEAAGVSVLDELEAAAGGLSLFDVIAQDPRLEQFEEFLVATGLRDEMESSGSTYTIFAPTDDAVAALDAPALRALQRPDALIAVTRNHVVDGVFTSSDLSAGTLLDTLGGGRLRIRVRDDGTIRAGGADLVSADVAASNGIVHVIDAVVLPPVVATETELNVLVGANPILFGPGSAEILAESITVLEQVAQALGDNSAGRVEIQGHSDSDGDEQVNLDLSQERADAVLAFLVDRGVDVARLDAVGYGESQPLVSPEESDADKAANRRIEFVIT